jgi:thiol:disulfide interchange protein DsbD
MTMYRRKGLTALIFTALFLISASACLAATKAVDVLKTEVRAYRFKEAALLVVTLEMEKDWYTYADDPGGMGKPTRLFGATADGNGIIPVYPDGIRKPDSFDPSVTVNAYKSGTRLYALLPPEGTKVFPVSMTLDLLLCHPTKCVPVRRDLSFGEPALDPATLPPASDQPWWSEFIKLAQGEMAESNQSAAAEPFPADGEAFSQWDFTPRYLQPGLEVASLLSAVLMGLLAGLILNIMPCVLPVVSLKLSALLNAASEDVSIRVKTFREHNAFFVLGVLTFFLVLAIVLGATGQAWGALFQNKWLVLGVAGLVLALSLSLFGIFHLPVIDLKFGSDSGNPKVQAFFTGCLTTLLATPCSGPFLGGVLSWALVQGPFVIAAVFMSIGVGMSLPYLLLIVNPNLSRFLPRSGPWIEYVEKGIAFFLVATAFYLAAIALGSESLRIFAPLWGVLLFGWLWMRTRTAGVNKRWAIRMASLALFFGLVIWTTPTPQKQVWEPFNPVQFSQQLGKEKLFLDFTADWCPTCKALEATVLTPENVTRWSKEYGVTFIKVDMTERNPDKEGLLRALGSASIPTGALFGLGEESKSPMVLRDLFTESQLEKILKSWN